MRIKIIITVVLIASLMTIVVFTSMYKKDDANLQYIPSFSADNTKTTINISGLEQFIADAELRNFVQNLIYDYSIKYVDTPIEEYKLNDTSLARAISIDGINTYTFMVSNEENELNITIMTLPTIWAKGVVTDGKNTFESSSSLVPQPSYEGN